MNELQRLMALSGLRVMDNSIADSPIGEVNEKEPIVEKKVPLNVTTVMKKHNMLKEDVMSRLKEGTFKIMEHVDDVDKAEAIALQKIFENPEHFSGQDFENKITYKEMTQKLNSMMDTVTPAEFHTIVENIMTCVDFEDIDNYAKLGKYIVEIVTKRSDDTM